MLTRKNELWQSVPQKIVDKVTVVLTQKNELWQSKAVDGLYEA